jgi:hypothetical protein
MELSGTLPTQSSREKLWSVIFSPEAWKEALPDTESCEQTNENEFELEIPVELGFIKGHQSIKIIFSEIVEGISSSFSLENKLVKSATGTFEILNPDEVTPPEDDEGFPVGTQAILAYTMEMDMGNPLFNAALEGFKGKIKEGLEEILQRLEDEAAAV